MMRTRSGDSSGPLFDSKENLVGIVSFGPGDRTYSTLRCTRLDDIFCSQPTNSCFAISLPNPSVCPVLDICKTNPLPVVYSRVSGAIDWIEKKICFYLDHARPHLSCKKKPKGVKSPKKGRRSGG